MRFQNLSLAIELYLEEILFIHHVLFRVKLMIIFIYLKKKHAILIKWELNFISVFLTKNESYYL